MSLNPRGGYSPVFFPRPVSTITHGEYYINDILEQYKTDTARDDERARRAEHHRGAFRSVALYETKIDLAMKIKDCSFDGYL